MRWIYPNKNEISYQGVLLEDAMLEDDSLDGKHKSKTAGYTRQGKAKHRQ